MAQKEELLVGEFVWLNSGSPKLTIEEISDDTAYCVWFDNGELKRSMFKLSSLTKDNPDTIDLGDYY